MVRQLETKEEYDQAVTDAAEANKLLCIDFYATWCGPCKLMAPKFEKYSAEFEDAIFLKIDIDEAALEEVVDDMDIKVMPTFILIKGGEQITETGEEMGMVLEDRLEGNVPDQLYEAIKKNK